MTLWALIPPDLQAALLAIPRLHGRRVRIPKAPIDERNRTIRTEHEQNVMVYGLSRAESIHLIVSRYPLTERRIRQILGE